MKRMRLSAVAPSSRRRAYVAKLSTEVPALLRRAHASGRAGCQPGPVRPRARWWTTKSCQARSKVRAGRRWAAVATAGVETADRALWQKDFDSHRPTLISRRLLGERGFEPRDLCTFADQVCALSVLPNSQAAAAPAALRESPTPRTDPVDCDEVAVCNFCGDLGPPGREPKPRPQTGLSAPISPYSRM